MFGNKLVNTQKAIQNIARQKMMRGQATDANMLNNFGSLGQGAASQALSNTLRGLNQSTNSANTSSGSNNVQQVNDANKRRAAGIINSVQKSGGKSSVGGSILGALGK
jgi:hypothetical protein